MDCTVYYLQLFFFPLYAYASSPSCHTIYLLSASSRLVAVSATCRPVLWSRNFLFPLRLWISKSYGSGSDISFVSTFYHRFHIKKWIFHVFFMIEYLPNSHAGFYTMWILIFIYYWSWPGAGSRSRNFDIPAPAKSSGSLRLRLHNTAVGSSVHTDFT